MERRFVIYPQTIRSENTPFASGSQRNRHRMALSGKRCLAGNFASPTISELVSICIQQKLQIIQGDKVIEIKSPDYNKGSEVSRQLKKEYYDFILAIGDDTTDEDMFKALPKNAATIKVGYVSETARYNLPSQEQVLPLLQTLVNISGESSTNDKVRKGLNSALHFFKELLNLK